MILRPGRHRFGRRDQQK